MTDRVEAGAGRLAAAFETGKAIDSLGDGERPETRADSFAIQDAVFDRLGYGVGAWKVGGSPGTEPTSAPIAASKLYSSGKTLDPAGHRSFGIEAEIAFRLARDLPAREKAYDADEVRAALESMIVVIEVVESRFSAWPKIDPLWALMDFQANDSLVLGTENPVPHDLDFSGQPVRLLFDGKTEFEGTGTFGGGDPFVLMAWLASHAKERTGALAGRGLKAGDIVTTGSWNGVSLAAPSVSVRAEFAGIGQAEMSFA